MFRREFRGGCLRYFPWGDQGDSLGGGFGGNPGRNLGCKLWTEKNLIKNIKIKIWVSNPGQIDDYPEMR